MDKSLVSCFLTHGVYNIPCKLLHGTEIFDSSVAEDTKCLIVQASHRLHSLMFRTLKNRNSDKIQRGISRWFGVGHVKRMDADKLLTKK